MHSKIKRHLQLECKPPPHPGSEFLMAKHNPTNTDILGGGPMLGLFSIFWVGGEMGMGIPTRNRNWYKPIFLFFVAKVEPSKQRYIQPVLDLMGFGKWVTFPNLHTCGGQVPESVELEACEESWKNCPKFL